MTYSFADTAKIVRVSAARLRYWNRTQLVPATASADGRHAYGFRDLVSLKSLVGLIESGVPLRRIRRSLARLRESAPELEQPLGLLRVWAGDRVVLRRDGQLMEPDGQLLLCFDSPREAAPAALPRAADEPAGARPPQDAYEWFERGCELEGEGAQLGDAERCYLRAIELDPSLADAHCNLGTLRFNRGDRMPARRCYEAALRADPGHLEANFNLANLLEEAGRREAALRHYKRALAADPMFAEAWLNLALLYEKLELPRRARDHWRRYLQLVPEGHWADVARRRLREPGAAPD